MNTIAQTRCHYSAYAVLQSVYKFADSPYLESWTNDRLLKLKEFYGIGLFCTLCTA